MLNTTIGRILTFASLVILTTIAPIGATYAATSSSDTTPAYASQWGSFGSGNGQFDFPYGAAINTSNGNVYVADSFRNRIQEFTSDGTYVTQWGSPGSGNGQFNLAFDIAINQSNGNVYVVDGSNRRVQEFTSSGTYITKWGSLGSGNGQFNAPYGIAINPTNNNVYVADSSNARIQEFTSDGTYVTQWGSYGSGNGQFGGPRGVAVDPSNNNVYVADINNDRIQEFTSDGTYVTQWGTSGSGNGQFNTPYGLSFNPLNSHVYVADYGNDRIQEFTSDGTYVTQWGTSGSGNGQFSSPARVAIDSSGNNFYVVDEGNNRIQKFTLLQNLAQVSAPGTSADIKVSLPSGSNITNESAASSTKMDSGYSYPLGLLNFTFATPGGTSGATVPVQITYQTNLNPSQVVPRKYNSATKTYATIPGATVTQTTLNGQPALLVSYNITDGGSLDEDGTANGIIVDPVGLAKIGSLGSLKAPSTGSGIYHNLISSAALYAGLSLFLLGAGLWVRMRSKKI